jgi:hypothetical protein
LTPEQWEKVDWIGIGMALGISLALAVSTVLVMLAK